MNINIELNRNFVNAYNKMQNEHGEEMAALNGFAQKQLSYTDFIDNFVDTETVADASIDGNANVGQKDIVTLINEMPKPHQKLLAFNKIFYELNKKYGFHVANEWLKNEWDGHLYLHDANTSTFVHYCFSGDTKIITDKGNKRLDELVNQDIRVLNKDGELENATVKNFGKAELRKLTLERRGSKKEIMVTGNHRWFVLYDDSEQIVETDDLQVGMNIPWGWTVVSIEETNIVEDTYCAVVPGTQSFTLADNVCTHNCFAYDLKDLAEKGLFFIDNFNAEPPQHLETFVDFVKEFVSWTCNRSSGAVGLPNLIPYMYYFWKKDCDEHIYTDNIRAAKQQIQRLIYALNQPFLRGGIQSAFTNTSIFDHPYLEALFGGSEFPDGTFMIDEIEGIMDFQKLFLETMAEIRSNNMMTFPVEKLAA